MQAGSWQGRQEACSSALCSPCALHVTRVPPLTAAQLQQRLHAASRVPAAATRRRRLIGNRLLAQHLADKRAGGQRAPCAQARPGCGAPALSPGEPRLRSKPYSTAQRQPNQLPLPPPSPPPPAAGWTPCGPGRRRLDLPTCAPPPPRRRAPRPASAAGWGGGGVGKGGVVGGGQGGRELVRGWARRMPHSRWHVVTRADHHTTSGIWAG